MWTGVWGEESWGSGRVVVGGVRLSAGLCDTWSIIAEVRKVNWIVRWMMTGETWSKGSVA